MNAWQSSSFAGLLLHVQVYCQIFSPTDQWPTDCTNWQPPTIFFRPSEITPFQFLRTGNVTNWYSCLSYYYWTKSVFLLQINTEVINQIKNSWNNRPNGEYNITLEITQLGGQFCEISHDYNAFVHRDAKYELHCIYSWDSRPKNLNEVR